MEKNLTKDKTKWYIYNGYHYLNKRDLTCLRCNKKIGVKSCSILQSKNPIKKTKKTITYKIYYLCRKCGKDLK